MTTFTTNVTLKSRCSKIYKDKISRKVFNREGLSACMEYLRAADTLVIYSLTVLVVPK